MVYDYAAGKADWFAWGLPREGRAAQVAAVGEVARRDVPTSGLTDQVADVKARAQAADFDVCVVVNEQRVVLGLLRRRELDADPAATAEQVMQAGPTTYRPDVPAVEAGSRMRERQVAALTVTTRTGCSWACCGAKTPSVRAQAQRAVNAELPTRRFGAHDRLVSGHPQAFTSP